jgi:hypothetical protein
MIQTISECGITVIIMFSMRTQIIVLDGSVGRTNTIKVREREASHDSNLN